MISDHAEGLRIQPPAAAHVPFAGAGFAGSFGSFVGPTQAPLTAHFTMAGEEAAVDAGGGGGVAVDTDGGATGADPPLGIVTSGELGFTGPPMTCCFAGPPTGVCFLGPPTEVCAKARLEEALRPRKTTNTTAPFFMARPFTASAGNQSGLYINP
jgi:hypothetical protein